MRAALAAGAAAALTAAMAPAVAAAAGLPGNGGSFELTARSPTAAARYAPTFTGNGLLGVRVPAAGQGYAGGTVPADSELAGFYARPSASSSARTSPRGPPSRCRSPAAPSPGSAGRSRVTDSRSTCERA